MERNCQLIKFLPEAPTVQKKTNYDLAREQHITTFPNVLTRSKCNN